MRVLAAVLTLVCHGAEASTFSVYGSVSVREEVHRTLRDGFYLNLEEGSYEGAPPESFSEAAAVVAPSGISAASVSVTGTYGVGSLELELRSGPGATGADVHGEADFGWGDSVSVVPLAAYSGEATVVFAFDVRVVGLGEFEFGARSRYSLPEPISQIGAAGWWTPDGWEGSSPGIFEVQIPLVPGERIEVSAYLHLHADLWPYEHRSLTGQLRYAGMRVIDADGAEIAFEVESQSGFDYSRPVPEPAAGSLAGVGLIALALRRGA